MRPVRFVAVGELMVDVVAAGAGHDARIAVRPGGSAANAAVWAAAAGAESSLVGRVGDDPPGRLLRAELDARGVGCDVAVDPEAATGAFLLLDAQIRAQPGANALLAPPHLPEDLEADVVLLSAYLPPLTLAAAARRAAAPWVALDAGRLRAEPPRGVNAVFHSDVAEPPEPRPGIRLVCVTSGPAGASGHLDGTPAEAQPPFVAEGEALGAGDAFVAATLVALARGASLAEALDEGCRCGALAASSPDGWPVSN